MRLWVNKEGVPVLLAGSSRSESGLKRSLESKSKSCSPLSISCVWLMVGERRKRPRQERDNQTGNGGAGEGKQQEQDTRLRIGLSAQDIAIRRSDELLPGHCAGCLTQRSKSRRNRARQATGSYTYGLHFPTGAVSLITSVQHKPVESDFARTCEIWQVACALLMSGESLEKYESAKQILVLMGTYFQVQVYQASLDLKLFIFVLF